MDNWDLLRRLLAVVWQEQVRHPLWKAQYGAPALRNKALGRPAQLYGQPRHSIQELAPMQMARPLQHSMLCCSRIYCTKVMLVGH